MKKLLVPIDFSENSENAISYASKIADKHGFEIDLIHVFIGHNRIYASALSGDELIDPKVGFAKRAIESIKNNLKKSHPNLIVNEVFRDGNLYEEISRQTASTSYSAIIMGTKGSSGLESIFTGSNTYDVILNTRTPVLALPIQATELPTNRIGLLCNFKEAELDVLKQAIPLYGKNFELVLIHINATDKKISELDAQFKDWIDKICSEIGIEDISYIIKPKSYYIHQSDNVSNAIVNVIVDEGIEVILITKSKKSIFRKLLNENITKKLAYQISIPTFFAKVST